MPQIVPINPGWLLLFCGLVLLAAGLLMLLLRQSAAERASLSAAPVISLTPSPLYTAAPVVTPLVSAPVEPTATDTGTRSLSPTGLMIETPICYDAPQQSVLCLGRVYNIGSEAAENVRLRVGMQQNGQLKVTKPVAPEQRYIAPGEFAPYRVRFEQVFEEQIGLNAVLDTVDNLHRARYILNVSEESGLLESDSRGYERYVITATVKNPYNRAIQGVQVIATLSDSAGRLTGYRIETLFEGLQSGESRSLRFDIVPQIVDVRYIHTLVVLGWDD